HHDRVAVLVQAEDAVRIRVLHRDDFGERRVDLLLSQRLRHRPLLLGSTRPRLGSAPSLVDCSPRTSIRRALSRVPAREATPIDLGGWRATAPPAAPSPGSHREPPRATSPPGRPAAPRPARPSTPRTRMSGASPPRPSAATPSPDVVESCARAL